MLVKGYPIGSFIMCFYMYVQDHQSHKFYPSTSLQDGRKVGSCNTFSMFRRNNKKKLVVLNKHLLNWDCENLVVGCVRQVVILHSKVCTKISLGRPQSGHYEEVLAS